MRTTFLCLMVLLFTNSSHGADDEMRQCQIKGVRGAWGALARFLDAPAKIKYAPMEQIRIWFHDENPPADGIYVAEELSKQDREEYSVVALHGWARADQWVAAGETYPGYTYLSARLYRECMDQLGH